MLGLALVVVIFFAIPPHAALSVDQVRTILVHAVIVGVAALGMSLVIISGGIDLSVGSAVALAGVTGAIALDRGFPAWLAVAVSLATGAACGLYNGLLVTMLRLPPFIATLGTLGFYRGLAKWISDSRPISPGRMQGLEQLLQPRPARGYEWLVVAPGVWLLLILSIATAVLLRHTVYGRHTLAVGGNPTAAAYAGVSLSRVRIVTYSLAGVFVGLAGLLQLSRLTQGDPTVAVGLELDVIAAVVIGGASLSGGSGSILGTICGALMTAYLKNRCAVLGWPNYVQELIVGHIIIAAVALDMLRRRRASQ
jgi:ribose transport system permease protein